MPGSPLDELWRLRNAAAETLALSEEQMRRVIGTASVADLVALLETFSPARSAGPEWTRTFEPLIERLWTWRDDATLAALAADFRARGAPWLANRAKPPSPFLVFAPALLALPLTAWLERREDRRWGNVSSISIARRLNSTRLRC